MRLDKGVRPNGNVLCKMNQYAVRRQCVFSQERVRKTILLRHVCATTAKHEAHKVELASIRESEKLFVCVARKGLRHSRCRPFSDAPRDLGHLGQRCSARAFYVKAVAGGIAPHSYRGQTIVEAAANL